MTVVANPTIHIFFVVIVLFPFLVLSSWLIFIRGTGSLPVYPKSESTTTKPLPEAEELESPSGESTIARLLPLTR